MTVPVETSRSSYAPGGATTVFSTGFYFRAETELVVKLTPSGGVESVKVLGVDYTVTMPADVGSPGSVTMLVAPAAGSALVIEREVPITQVTSFRTSGTFSRAVHEDAMDELVFQNQQLARRISDLESAGAPGSVIAGDGLYFSGSVLHVGAGDGISSAIDSIEVQFGPAPANVTAAAGSSGVENTASRSDHKHNISVDVPEPLADGTGGEALGAAASVALSDHIHSHGYLTNPLDHAVATGAAAGFMSAADKAALTALQAGGKVHNFIHNGAMHFWQRGSAAQTVNTAAVALEQARQKVTDRFYGYVKNTSGAFTLSGIFSRPAPAAGEVHYATRIRKNGTAGATDGVIGLVQELERHDVAEQLAGQQVSVRFRWRRGTNFTGAPLVRLVQSDDPDETWIGAYVGAVITEDLSPAAPGTTWETYTGTFAALDATTVSAALVIGAHHTANVGGGATDYLDVQDVSLVVGAVPPSEFALCAGTYNQELELVEGYYEKSYRLVDAPATVTATNLEMLNETLDGSTIANGDMFPFDAIKFRHRKIRGSSGTVSLWSSTGVANKWFLMGSEENMLAILITDCSFRIGNDTGAGFVLDSASKALFGHWAADFDY